MVILMANRLDCQKASPLMGSHSEIPKVIRLEMLTEMPMVYPRTANQKVMPMDFQKDSLMAKHLACLHLEIQTVKRSDSQMGYQMVKLKAFPHWDYRWDYHSVKRLAKQTDFCLVCLLTDCQTDSPMVMQMVNHLVNRMDFQTAKHLGTQKDFLKAMLTVTLMDFPKDFPKDFRSGSLKVFLRTGCLMDFHLEMLTDSQKVNRLAFPLTVSLMEILMDCRTVNHSVMLKAYLQMVNQMVIRWEKPTDCRMDYPTDSLTEILKVTRKDLRLDFQMACLHWDCQKEIPKEIRLEMLTEMPKVYPRSENQKDCQMENLTDSQTVKRWAFPRWGYRWDSLKDCRLATQKVMLKGCQKENHLDYRKGSLMEYPRLVTQKVMPKECLHLANRTVTQMVMPKDRPQILF